MNFTFKSFVCALEDLLMIENSFFFLNQDEACNQMALCRKAEFPVTHSHMEKCCNTGTFSVSNWLVSYRM